MLKLTAVLAVSGISLAAPLDLSDWMALAIEHSPDMVQALSGVRRAEASRSSTRAALLPSLTFSASAGHSWSSVDMGSFGVAETDQESYSAGLTLSQDILSAGGADWLSLRSASLGLEAAELDYRSSLLGLERDMARAFYDAVEAAGLVDAAGASLERSAALLERTELLYDLGAVRELELLQARMQEASDRLALLRSGQALSQALTELHRTAGIDPAAGHTVDAGAVLRPLDREAILALSGDFSSSPALRAAVLSGESAGLELEAARRQYWPSLGASGSWNWSDDRFEPDEIGRNDSWNVRVSLTWPIFDGWLRDSRVQSASAALMSAEASVASSEADLAASVDAALDQLLAACENLELATLTLEYARRRMDLSAMSYELGDLGMTDLLEAQAALSEAEAGLVTARTSSLKAEVDYMVLTGMDPRLGE